MKRAARLWTLTTGAHAVPFLAVAVVLPALNPIMLPFALLAVAHAWAIPELYAARGANVLRRRTRESTRAEQVALGLLGDLLDHLQRELHSRHRFVLERGALGVWVLGEAGALLVRPGARTVHCYCVKVPAEELPPSDRIAHLLLALRSDEAGFATLANLAFAGAPWRLRRRLAPDAREAFDRALEEAR